MQNLERLTMDEYINREAAVKSVLRMRRPENSVAQNRMLSIIQMDMLKLPAADVAPVVHGRWIFTKRHLWYKDENGNIDEWRVDSGFHNGPECQICHTAFCVHCTPDWSTTECEIGHYYCSECAETSRDAHEDYCPNCGAKMDGGDNDA